ncbi:MAG TPA: hypothetical protein VFE62_12580 [Gemmataceae bacterium]|nr:hypothetical protein [Gemmataceae bacterium]
MQPVKHGETHDPGRSLMMTMVAMAAMLGLLVASHAAQKFFR